MSLERHFSRICASLHISWDFQLQEEYTRWEAVSPDSAEKIPTFHADFPGFTLKIVEHSPYLLVSDRHPGPWLYKGREPLSEDFAWAVRIATGEFAHGQDKLNTTACTGSIMQSSMVVTMDR
jgi:hypothetical protein